MGDYHDRQLTSIAQQLDFIGKALVEIEKKLGGGEPTIQTAKRAIPEEPKAVGSTYTNKGGLVFVRIGYNSNKRWLNAYTGRYFTWEDLHR